MKRRPRKLILLLMEEKVPTELKEIKMVVAMVRANKMLHPQRSLKKLSSEPIILNRSLLFLPISISPCKQTRTREP